MNRSQRSFPIACAAFIAVSGKGAVLVSQKWMNKASSLLVAAIQALILLGAVVGGLLDRFSVHATFIGSIVLAVAALLLIGSGRHLLKPGGTNTSRA
ncbi:MAG: hypothetical protein JSS15_14790 [Proteobacteria bacterium]|nr:hypothetical protein [Pseudomonadota bacterium]